MKNIFGLDGFIWFFGIVEDRFDPLKLGRLKVRIFDIHPEDSSQVSTDDLPWAYPIQPIISAALGGVGYSPLGSLEGSYVFGFFLDGERKQQPAILGTIGGNTLGNLLLSGNSGNGFGIVPDTSNIPTEVTDRDLWILVAVSALEASTAQGRADVAQSIYNRIAFGQKRTIHEVILEANQYETVTNSGGRTVWSKIVNREGAIAVVKSAKGYSDKKATTAVDSTAASILDPRLQANAKSGVKNRPDFRAQSAQGGLIQASWFNRDKQTFGFNNGSSFYSRRNSVAPGNPPQFNLKNINTAETAKKADANTSMNVADLVSDTSPQATGIDQAKGEPLGFEPASSYFAKYPYNKVYQSESGHIIEIDDSPNDERLKITHRTGSYAEINSSGRTIIKSVDDAYTIVAKDNNIYVDGDVNIHVNGNVNLDCYNDLNMSVAGNINMLASETINIKGSSVKIESTGNIDLKAGGNINEDGSNIYLNSGNASETGLGNGNQRDSSKQKETSEDMLEYQFDANEDGRGSYRERQRNAGNLKRGGAIGAAKERDGGQGKAIPPDTLLCRGIDNKADIPDSTQLSKYFTLADLTIKPKVSHYRLIAQRGLTKGQIACNLKLLAENILDKLHEKYPDMILTSVFRTVQNGKSQHEIGQAADIQFTSANSNKQLYFERAKWIRDNISYDQMILEYGGNNPWIHISFNPNGNRAPGNSKVLTYNGEDYSPGLTRYI